MTTPVNQRPSYLIVTIPVPITLPDGRVTTAQVQFNECSMCKALLPLTSSTSEHTRYHEAMMFAIDNRVRLEVQSALSAQRQQHQTTPVQEPAESTPGPVKKKRPKHLGKKVNADSLQATPRQNGKREGRCSRCFHSSDKFYDRVVNGTTVYEGLCESCHAREIERDAATVYSCEMCGVDVQDAVGYSIHDTGNGVARELVCKACYYTYKDTRPHCDVCNQHYDLMDRKTLLGNSMCTDCYNQKIGTIQVTLDPDTAKFDGLPGIGLFQHRSHQDWGWDQDAHKGPR